MSFPVVRKVVNLDIRELTVPFPWQHWTVSYCWQLHVGQQQEGQVLFRFHDNNGYANAWPCCAIRVWLALLHFVIIIDGNFERLLSLFTAVLAFLSLHRLNRLNGDLGEPIVIILPPPPSGTGQVSNIFLGEEFNMLCSRLTWWVYRAHLFLLLIRMQKRETCKKSLLEWQWTTLPC
jgi:hypothetical protein